VRMEKGNMLGEGNYFLLLHWISGI
jgi:hypothetical protein